MVAGVRKIAHYREKKQAAPHITDEWKDPRPHSMKANRNQELIRKKKKKKERREKDHHII